MNHRERQQRIAEILEGLDETFIRAGMKPPKGKLMRFGEFLLAKKLKALETGNPQERASKPLFSRYPYNQ